MDYDKKIQALRDRLIYIQEICGGKDESSTQLLEHQINSFMADEGTMSPADKVREFAAMEELFNFFENKLDQALTPMDRVRIVRNRQRICLNDILENVYDNYMEIGGQDENSIDPALLIARAYITRRSGKKVINQPVMVIGQEKGHGEEFRNGGSVKPWGNAKALHYMRVAETENIPIHTYVFTPGAYPVEDYPGAAQQIAHNLYEMATLEVPVLAVFSEGGSGGAEAIALADMRLMFSHGYYSVISPEGAAAIESKIRQGQRAPVEFIEKCADQLHITARNNLEAGYIDRVIQEPPLGARPYHHDFFKELRNEIIRATDEIVLNAKSMKIFRGWALERHKNREQTGDQMLVQWRLSEADAERLVARRYQKYMNMAQKAYLDNRPGISRAISWLGDVFMGVYGFWRYDLFAKHSKTLVRAMGEMGAEVNVISGGVTRPWRKLMERFSSSKEDHLTHLSSWDGQDSSHDNSYVSPQAKEDRAVSCPKSERNGCLDQWAPDLFGDFAGVCANCGHHFFMEHQWYLHNLFDTGSIWEFNQGIEAGNPLHYEGFEAKLTQAKEKTGLKSSCLTFDARIKGVKVVTAMLVTTFRGGSVGAAEGEKFIQAAERARIRRCPFIAYVHGTAGIRIHEGTNGLIQMPRCTVAVRRYIDEGGLYMVIYDTNSYAGPVASFLGCSPYQGAIQSANIGFAGPGVIKETTGLDVPLDYHQAYRALSRGHIQNILDRRDVRNYLWQAMQTMGGQNLYYRR